MPVPNPLAMNCGPESALAIYFEDQMSRAKKIWLPVVAAIAAIAAFIASINTILDFYDRIFGNDNDSSINISQIVMSKAVTWYRGDGPPTGEISYIADLRVEKTGRSHINKCNIMINFGGPVYYSDETNRSLGRGLVSKNWRYEYKVKASNFVPDATLQIKCDDRYSNPVKIKFEIEK